MGRLQNISSRPNTHIDSSLNNIAKPTSVFVFTGNGNPELGTEYDSIFLSYLSRSVNFLPALRSSHPRLLTKSESTFNFISPDTTPPAVEKRVCLHNSWLQHHDLTPDPILF